MRYVSRVGIIEELAFVASCSKDKAPPHGGAKSREGGDDHRLALATAGRSRYSRSASEQLLRIGDGIRDEASIVDRGGRRPFASLSVPDQKEPPQRGLTARMKVACAGPFSYGTLPGLLPAAARS